VAVESVVNGSAGPDVRTAERDSGLVRVIGPVGLTAAIVNSVVGSGAFLLPGAIAAGAGRFGPLAFLACAVAMGPVVICFAEGGRRVPTSGGPYGYIEAAFGPPAGFIAASLLLVGCVLACGGVLAALGGAAASLVPSSLATAARPAVVLGTLAFFVVANINGAATGTRLIEAGTALKLIPLLVFVVVGATAMLHHASESNLGTPSVAGFGRALIMALYLLNGMEIPLSASGEVAHPTRTIPRAIVVAMTFVTVLYVANQTILQALLGPSLATSPAPLADAMARINPALQALMLAGAGVSILSWLGSDLLGSPRTLFVLARDGLLPATLGRLHPRTHAPHVAILCYGAIAAALALTGTYAELAILNALAIAALYATSCAAVWTLSRRGAEEPRPGRAVLLNFAGILGIATMLLVIALASWSEILGLCATIALATLGYVLRRWMRRNVAHA
jgi:basic amino acid/polyamine antiporter, APA family